MPICDSAQPASPAIPDPNPNAQVSTRRVGTPVQLAIARFCVTARTKRPNRVRVSSSQVANTTSAAKPMIAMRLKGRTTPVIASIPPDIQEGFST